jgi:ribosomal protein L35AE/L33A
LCAVHNCRGQHVVCRKRGPHGVVCAQTTQGLPTQTVSEVAFR